MVRVWRAVGYPYHAGGTAYEVASGESETAAAFDRKQDDPQVAERYVQLQELVDLICRWRMLNESSVVHRRVASTEADGTLQQWAQLNASFDQATRAAMVLLASGESAGEMLSQSRERLEQLETLIAGLGADSYPTRDTG